MDLILVKIFAAALAFSQSITDHEVRTRFDAEKGREDVAALLSKGCAQVINAFDLESLNIDDLIATAMDDPAGISGGTAVFRGINFSDLHAAYRRFCKNEATVTSPVDLGNVIEFYNRTLTDLPDATRLKGFKLPGLGTVLDTKGERLSEIYEQYHRRVWLSIGEIPPHVQQAFVSAEDKRFYQHQGIDERSVVRAFIGNLMRSGRPQGGSTITQQVVKNLLVGEEVSYERKIREMVLASQIERNLSKPEILELYLNSIYLGRGSWGIELAARSYFGKPAVELTLPEAALLAALAKGPNNYNPDRHPARAKDRVSYVLTRLHEDEVISEEALSELRGALPQVVANDGGRRGSYYIDHLHREARSVTVARLTEGYTVRSTLNVDLQRATEAALQEGLAQYEISAGRARFEGAEANLAEAIKRLELEDNAPDRPSWQRALEQAAVPLYDVHWERAVVLEKPSARGGDTAKVGLVDGRVLSMRANRQAARAMRVHDVVFVHIVEGKGKHASRAELRIRPNVQGAAVVLENRTGRILAMAGGFSYPLSQLNRTTQASRQPGSALKPLTYLTALQQGLQPNTFVRDESITLPPIGGRSPRAGRDSWTPKNYDGGESGLITLRTAIEQSKNLATVRLLNGIDKTPTLSLDRICAVAVEARIYKDCERYYPFVLGAQPVRPVDLAVFYAAIANGGRRVEPYTIETIEQTGRTIYAHTDKGGELSLADAVSFYQLKSMLQGVLARGTGRAYARLASYVAGKTGTTDGENDAWFVGFSNDVTIAIWVGYDNADGTRRTLGGGRTGGNVAIPIFEPIIQAAWRFHAPRTALEPPAAALIEKMVRVKSDQGEGARAASLPEYLRRDEHGRALDARYRLVSRDNVEARAVPPARRVPPREPVWREWQHRNWTGWGERAPWWGLGAN